MRALTVRQPWAGLIAAGRKTLECRGRRTEYRGRLAIHAGLTEADEAAEAFAACRKQGGIDDALWTLCGIRGAIIGLVDLVGCRPWADTADLPAFLADLDAQEGRIFVLPETVEDARAARATKDEWLWELRNPRILPTPRPCGGKQGLWVPSDLVGP